MQALPNEILCEMFKFIHQMQPNARTPIGLSHVCARWRVLMLNLSELWTTVHIYQYDANVLRDILLRSNNRPLNIDVHFPNPVPKRATFGLWKTLILLSSEMTRCRRLNIAATRPVYKLLCNAFRHGLAAPLLSRLELRCHQGILNTDESI